MSERITRIGGWLAIALGILDWFGRYESARDLLATIVGSHLMNFLSQPWLSPVLVMVGFALLLAPRLRKQRASIPAESRLSGVSQARGGTESHEESPTGKARSLADEIFKFLEGVGPGPQPRTDRSTSVEEILNTDSAEISAWVDRVHHTYFARFKDRLDAVLHELAANGVDDHELHAMIDPQVMTGDTLRTIAERLLLLSTGAQRQ